jgi:hypothetical protein
MITLTQPRISATTHWNGAINSTVRTSTLAKPVEHASGKAQPQHLSARYLEV